MPSILRHRAKWVKGLGLRNPKKALPKHKPLGSWVVVEKPLFGGANLGEAC